MVVLANFSDYNSPAGADYVVRGWPGPVPGGRRWIEVTQGLDGSPGREVPDDWIGREPIFPWEAKVYRTVAA